eukprot:COSAG02_NODE_3822_length_6184_cov_537.928219_5_plen_523_part_00
MSERGRVVQSLTKGQLAAGVAGMRARGKAGGDVVLRAPRALFAPRLASTWALVLSAQAVQLTGPPELVAEDADTVFKHEISCIGERFRFFAPFKRPVTQDAQYGRPWSGYRSLPTYSPSIGLTTGRLLLAMPRAADTGLPSGCEEVQTHAAEYGDSSMEGQICLVSRGGACTFSKKIENCEAAGAKAVVIFNRQGSGAFMIGPGVEYVPESHIGVLTVPYELYQQTRDFFPNVTVALEPQVEIALVAPPNCTAEALASPDRPADDDSSQTMWTETEIAQCESEISAQEAAAVSSAVADGLFSGKLVAGDLVAETSDDPYSACILEPPCIDTWTTVPIYTYTVISVGAVLMLCFIQITAMFCFGASRKPMKSRKPRRNFCCFPSCSPHLRCCKCCPVVPVFYKKPQEYLNTGIWRFFLYTWPFMPRKSDPKMTFVQRIAVTMMCTVIGLITLMVLGNTGVKYQGMRQGSGIELAGEAYESAMADMGEQDDWLGDFRKPFNMFICVTFQEFCKQIVRTLRTAAS